MINASLYAFQSVGLVWLFIIPLMLILTMLWLCAKIVKGMIRSLLK